MNIIIDTNVLLSALIKNSSTRRILLESDWIFYYPEISFHEVRKYKNLVMKKSGLNNLEYSKLISMLLDKIILVPKEQMHLKLPEAKEIMKNSDQDDIPFIAAALSIDKSFIWSNDKGYKLQNTIITINSNKIVELFELLYNKKL